MKSGTNTIFFIHLSKIPKEKKATCVKLVSRIRSLKEEVNRVRVTVGEDQLGYDGFINTVLATLSMVKCNLNSIISTLGAWYCTIDTKDFYYRISIANPDDYEYIYIYIYIYIPLYLVPDKII